MSLGNLGSGVACLAIVVGAGLTWFGDESTVVEGSEVGTEGAPTFYADVLPILEANCQSCHRRGEVAPFPLVTYEDARAEAGDMKRMVERRRMPPWSADNSVGVRFHNDRSLSDEQIATIVAWVDEGMAEGDHRVAASKSEFVEGWQIEPDMVVEVPPFPVPATGTVEYTYYIVPEVFEEDRWIRISELRPSNYEVTHHLLAHVRPPGSSYMRDYPVGEFFVPEPGGRRPAEGESGFRWRQSIGGYAPGSNPGEANFPEDQAVFVEAGSQIVFELHYTTKGETTVDRPRLGIDFLEGEPATRRLGGAVIDRGFEIPAHAANHPVDAGVRIMQPVKLLSMTPHMHLRGKSFEYRAVFPDGRSEVLLSVPQYDFNWQLTYYLEEPLELPVGTVIEGLAHYDNSSGNRHNPDPGSPIKWGDQSWEEMMVGFFSLEMDPATDPESVFGGR